MKKAMMLAAAIAVAACSRNPEPGVEETGRADTTTIGDTTVMTPQVDTTTQRDTTTYGRDTTTFDTTTVQPDTATVQPDTGMTGRDTTGWSDTTSQRDTTTGWGDTTSTSPDSARVPHGAKAEGDSALTEHNVPDSTQQQPQPQQ